MNILIISDYDQIALDLNTNLRKYGYKSVLLTTKHIEDDDTVINISNIKSKRILWLLGALRSFVYRHLLLWIKHYIYCQDISENSHYYSLRRIKKKVTDTPDVIIILFDYRIVTAKTISDLYKWSKAKILWMMVDMKPMTGGCSYAGKCINYQSDCKKCPAIGNALFQSFAQKILNDKKNNIKEVDLHMIAGSTFQAKQALSSTLFKNKPIDTIYFPCDGNVFKYRKKSEARKLLSLPLDKKIILCGAASGNAPRKGFKYLTEALMKLSNTSQIDNVILLVIGKEEPSGISKFLFPCVHLGWVDFDKLALAYQSSDVFVCPSIEDSGPIMVNQSIMCGTPVVAFKMGVCLDLIEDGENGYLADLEDAVGLCNGIKKILTLSEAQKVQMTKKCLNVSKDLNYGKFFQNIEQLIQSN